MRILVFAPRGTLDAAGVLPVSVETDTVTIICWREHAPDDRATISVAQQTLSARMTRLLSASLPGRMLTRILPLDAGSRFWRATARSAAVSERVRTADLLIAAERDAGFAVWNWQRQLSPGAAAVRGYAAARTWIEQRR